MLNTAPTFEAEFFLSSRRRLRNLASLSGPIVITANGALQSDNYAPLPFRQDSNFWYLTGINDPDIILVMDKNDEYLIVPERSERQIAFDGDLDYEAMQKTSGISEIIHAKEGWKRLGKKLKQSKTIATLKASPIYISDLAMYSNPARRRLIQKIKNRNSKLEIIDLRPQLATLRMIKSGAELAAIQYAIDHTIKVYNLIGENLQTYKSEQDIAADVARYFTQNQLGYSYSPIIAGGPRATILHYDKNTAALNDNECLLIDMGAAWGPYYCADITRTVAVNPSKRMQDVYDAVLDVQKFALSYLKPGILIKDYEIAVNKYMGEKLQELGLINNTDQTSIRKYYPHGTSHFLGLDVHDTGNYSKPLEAGMILTVEPGIYIPEESIGIRIEDDILITANGSKVLSADLPKSLTTLTIS